MHLSEFHLTYCTNIHPGESWAATFENLKSFIPKIKAKMAPDQAFAIGLRLSDEASKELVKEEKLEEFKTWLKDTNCYIFTLNGFPFGGFHRQVVKDEVHYPDWSTEERKAYTIRLFGILSSLLPDEMDGGISTSPLSYRHWHKSSQMLSSLKETACKNLLEVVGYLHDLKEQKGQVLHLDIEPEPDGVIENAAELMEFFKDWLVPRGITYLTERWPISSAEAESIIKEHIRVCYDVCHFAVAYEDHDAVLAAFEEEGIKVGKIQISAALKIALPEEKRKRIEIEKALIPFAESTYLHQVIGRAKTGKFKSYPDLPEALNAVAETEEVEWRIHFHVPVFLETYGQMASTQPDILKVLKLNCLKPFTHHLEVETYTWEVLPKDISLSLDESIVRELEWVKANLK